ncbi:MAG: tRNA (adenosine(37)-N6)-threonylcarbamoyltransferase complex ATPase subunit type 1 TsaE, partial [Alphaproteobacteria bacterium]
VTSPTFTLAHFYRGPGVGLIHVDAYRLETPEEFDDLTLDDFLDAHAIAVEWGEKVRDRLPPALEIEFAPDGPETRNLRLSSAAAAWRDRLRQIDAALQGLAPCP